MYILPSLRFLLTVHDLPMTHLRKLDTMVDQYLKRWAGLPKCATNAILHLDTALHIKNISTLYRETHAVTHCSTRLKGDTLVNTSLAAPGALAHRLQRRTAYKIQNGLQGPQNGQRGLERGLTVGYWPLQTTFIK